MKTINKFIICVLALVIWGCSSTSTQEDDSKGRQVLNYEKSNRDYENLVAKVIQSKATADDIDRLIRLYPLTSYYQPDNDIERRIKKASAEYMSKEEWIQCIRLNRGLLTQNYTSLTAHYSIAVCSQEAGDVETAKFHNQLLDSFVEAIWRSGDGQSADTAFYINSTDDLMAFVQLHQLIVVDQELFYQDKLPIQRVRVQNPETERYYTWYFDLTAQFRKAYINQLESR